MKDEFAPWRAEYFSRVKSSKCIFCDIAQNPQNDAENFVLFRAKYCFGIMNRYPYTLGEFMVIPYEHIDNIESLNPDIWLEISAIVQKGVAVLKNILNASGVNIGMNLGAAAGAGIAEHIHYHLVPRWERDTNFITTIAYTRVHGVPFMQQYKSLKSEFQRLEREDPIFSK
jgi:diadenosine tetraphosphate (Ap4A) HIT family hydrolase